MGDPIIKVKNISKIYHLYDNASDRLKEALHPFSRIYHKEYHALKNINLDISSNHSIGIIGMNGSGKSTLLKIITGILTPTSGSVEVKGKISALLELGAGFNPEFSGIDNVHFQCSIQGYSKEEISEMVPEIVDFAGIGDYIYQPVKTYSSGMYVRLAFAVAINVDPDVLVVDEALAVGDAYFQSKCMRRIKKFISSRKTLLFVSHDAGAVKSICDKAYLLHKGEMVDQGEPDRVFNFYNTLISEQVEELGNVDKEAARFRSGNKKIEIIDVVAKNSKGVPREIFVSGETISICIQIKVNIDIVDPAIGIMIRDRLGNDIFGINNNIMKESIGLVKKGQGILVNYKLPLNLGPNVYSLTVATHSHHTHIEDNYDWINNVLVFKVIPSNDLSFLGYCRLHPKFDIQLDQAQ